MYKWSKVWCIQADHQEVKLGQTITVSSSKGDKQVKVVDIVTREGRNEKKYDLLFTEDI